AALVARLAAALEPFERLGAGATTTFSETARVHRDTVAALAREPSDAIPALAGEDGRALAAVFDEIEARPAGDDLMVASADYPELFLAAIAERAVRRGGVAGARVRVLGLLEARLQRVDRIVLGGLVEGSWPPETRTDPGIRRPIRL